MSVLIDELFVWVERVSLYPALVAVPVVPQSNKRAGNGRILRIDRKLWVSQDYCSWWNWSSPWYLNFLIKSIHQPISKTAKEITFSWYCTDFKQTMRRCWRRAGGRGGRGGGDGRRRGKQTTIINDACGKIDHSLPIISLCNRSQSN